MTIFLDEQEPQSATGINKFFQGIHSIVHSPTFSIILRSYGAGLATSLVATAALYTVKFMLDAMSSQPTA